METWVWVLIVVAALILLALLVFWLTKGREKRHEQKRAEADELRLEADRGLSEAGRREAASRERAERAQEEQAEAERLQREADERRARAGDLEQTAHQEARAANEQRAEAVERARRAEEIDPDAPDPGDDFEVGEPRDRDVRPGGIGEGDEEVRYVAPGEETQAAGAPRTGEGSDVETERGALQDDDRPGDDRPGARRV
jgi:hypothetical protein